MHSVSTVRERVLFTNSSLNSSYPIVLTYSEAVVSTITAVVQTAVCLEQEEATGMVVIVGGDTRNTQTFSLSQ